MRWKLRRSRPVTDDELKHAEATAAREKAARRLEEARQSVGEVRSVVDELAEYRERNHFQEMFGKALGGT